MHFKKYLGEAWVAGLATVADGDFELKFLLFKIIFLVPRSVILMCRDKEMIILICFPLILIGLRSK